MAPSSGLAGRRTFWFQFVTTPTADTPGTTLLLHFDNRRYFFGRIAEGLQRACIQRAVGLKKVNTLFLTGPTTWDNMGGLIGMLLTMADVQAEDKKVAAERGPTGPRPRINIFGGPKMMHAMACARRFVFRTGMPLSIHETVQSDLSLKEPSYQDDNVDIWSFTISRTRSGMSSPVLRAGRSGSPTTVDRDQTLRKEIVNNMFDSDWKKDRLFEFPFEQIKLPAVIYTRDPETKALQQHRCTTMADAPHLSPDSLVLVRNPWPAATVEDLPPADNFAGSASIGYVVRGQPQRGKFLPQKAKDLGVKPGPTFSKLAAGESITLEDGSVITPEMVMTESEAGRGMAVLDVPSVDYLHDLGNKLDQLRENGILVGLQMISWMLGTRVYHSEEFNALVSSLPELQHVVTSPDTSFNHISMDSSAASAKRLSLIRPECFLEPIYNDQVGISGLRSDTAENSNITLAQRGMLARIAPKALIDLSEVPPLTDLSTIQISDEVRDRVPINASDHAPTPYDDVEILTLGTGSAVPSKYRNVSATLVRVPGLGSYLFDCGENTLGQLRRSYSPVELDAVLCDLRMIWISHLHADHHLGTLSVINARREAVKRAENSYSSSDLYVVSEPNMADFLLDFSSIQPLSGCVLLSVWNSKLCLNGAPMSVRSIPINIKSLNTVRVAHCHGAQAVSVTFANGFKFSYSGDCRPSAAFANIGKDSHVLLHEATFDDGMEGDAMAKKHCTTGEALGVAAMMKAKNVVLTHFSQRYQKLPVLTNIKFADQIKFEEGDEADSDDEPTLAENVVADVQTTDSSVNNAVHTMTASADSLLTKTAANLDMNICVAFDQMRVKYSQIPSMHLYYPAIERMFKIEQEKSQLAKEEAAAAQGQSNQKKDPKTAGDGINESSANNLYDKINRGKSSKKNNSQGGRANSTGSTTPTKLTDINTDSTSPSAATGRHQTSSKAEAGVESPTSKRMRKRQRQAEETAWHQAEHNGQEKDEDTQIKTHDDDDQDHLSAKSVASPTTAPQPQLANVTSTATAESNSPPTKHNSDNDTRPEIESEQITTTPTNKISAKPEAHSEEEAHIDKKLKI